MYVRFSIANVYAPIRHSEADCRSQEVITEIVRYSQYDTLQMTAWNFTFCFRGRYAVHLAVGPACLPGISFSLQAVEPWIWMRCNNTNRHSASSSHLSSGLYGYDQHIKHGKDALILHIFFRHLVLAR
jgi:hypothetical protein